MFREDELCDGLSADEMFLDDAFEHIGSDGVVPDSVRIYDCDGSLLAYPEAVGLGTINAILAFGEIQFFESALQVIPRFETDVTRSAFGLRGIRT